MAARLPALEQIGVTFLTAPLLARSAVPDLSLPTLPGYRWSWITRGPKGWEDADLPPATGAPPLAPPACVVEGWAKLTKEPTPH